MIGFARECGFSLREIGQLFSGRTYSTRMRQLARRKLGELQLAVERLHTMRSLLRSALRCDCLTAEQCGRRLPPSVGRRES